MTDTPMRDEPTSGADPQDADAIETEVVVVTERPALVDRRDVLEGVAPEITDEPRSTPRPDFARGQEEEPESPERLVKDRFSRGQEADPTLHEQVHEGDFATGQASTTHPELQLHGRFARGQQLSDEGNPNENEDED